MNENIVIKMQPNGLILHLNNEVDFQEIIKELELKLSQNRKFFGNSSVTISFTGRILSPLEEAKLVDVIHRSSDMKIVCILDKSEENNQINVRYLQYEAPQLDMKKYCRYYEQSLKEGQILESEGNIIVLGDVVEGSTLVAVGNVFIFGGIYGEVYAGVDSDSKAFVIAMDIQPEKLEINKIRYKTDKKRKKIKKNKDKMLIAYDKNIQVITEPYTNELLHSLI